MVARCPFSDSEPINKRGGFENIQFDFDAPRAGGKYRTKQGFWELVHQINKLGDKGKARLVTLLVDMRRLGEKIPN